MLSDSRRPFHVWILDYYLKRGVGLDLLKEFPDFQYSVLLSAVESMEIAGKAKDSGVFATFDKVVGFLSRGAPFFPCVCGLAALGFLHNGGQCGNLAIFRILLGHTIRTPEQWASIAYISTRQLTNICIKNTGFPPAALIAFYYAVFRLLINTPPVLPDGRPDYQTELFFIQCAKRVVGKIDKIKAVLQQLPIQELHEVHRIETILV